MLGLATILNPVTNPLMRPILSVRTAQAIATSNTVQFPLVSYNEIKAAGGISSYFGQKPAEPEGLFPSRVLYMGAAAMAGAAYVLVKTNPKRRAS